MLIQENQELGRQLSQGRVAQLEAELALQKKYSDELKGSQDGKDNVEIIVGGSRNSCKNGGLGASRLPIFFLGGGGGGVEKKNGERRAPPLRARLLSSPYTPLGSENVLARINKKTSPSGHSVF